MSDNERYAAVRGVRVSKLVVFQTNPKAYCSDAVVLAPHVRPVQRPGADGRRSICGIIQENS